MKQDLSVLIYQNPVGHSLKVEFSLWHQNDMFIEILGKGSHVQVGETSGICSVILELSLSCIDVDLGIVRQH